MYIYLEIEWKKIVFYDFCDFSIKFKSRLYYRVLKFKKLGENERVELEI